jgi:hypothetical protein
VRATAANRALPRPTRTSSRPCFRALRAGGFES